MRPLSERVAMVEHRLSSMETKVDEMHAILLQARGARWALVVLLSTISIISGVVGWVVSHWKLVIPLVMLGLIMVVAHADGPPDPRDHVHTNGSDWIRKNSYRGPTGELCCGLNDCKEISPEGVSTNAQGYFLKGLRETVPYSETMTSEDGRYWRCQWGGSRKCFFAPPPST